MTVPATLTLAQSPPRYRIARFAEGKAQSLTLIMGMALIPNLTLLHPLSLGLQVSLIVLQYR